MKSLACRARTAQLPAHEYTNSYHGCPQTASR
jgi:hypothetical protein